MAFATGSNYCGRANSVAIAAFGLALPVNFAAAIGWLVEIPVLILLVKVAFWFGRRWFSDSIPLDWWA